FHDTFPLGSQEDGTWAVESGFRRRQPLDENLGPAIPPLPPRQARLFRRALLAELQQIASDQFFELDGSHRYYNEFQNTYYQTAPAGRVRGESGPRLRFLERLRYYPDGVPLTFHLEASGYLQRPAGALPLEHGRLEWSGQLRGGVSQYREITPTLGHRPAL